MNETIGFLGLGSLGLPMAHNLLESGYPLAVYNRTAAKADTLVAQGARLAASPTDTLTPGGIVVSVLWDSAAVESVITTDGFLERLGPGGVHICMCTGSPEGARKLAALHAEHGSTYIDAPVFGRPEAAAARKLWIPFAGSEAAKERIRPVLTALGAQSLYDFGEEIGAATMVKLVGNFLLISAAQSMAEGFVTAEKMGLDLKVLVAMLTDSLFPAPIYQTYGTRLAEKMPSFALSGIPAKDLGLLQSVAARFDIPTPLAQTIRERLPTASS